MGVKVHTGEFPSVDGVPEGGELDRVIFKWQSVAYHEFPSNCDWLIRMLEETDRHRLWEKNIAGFTYPDRDSFLSKQVLIDFALTEKQVAAVIAALNCHGGEAASKELAQHAERNQQIRNEAAGGKTQQQIAEEFGIDQSGVSRIMRSTPHKTHPQVQLKLSQGTDPEKAATRILERFGNEFARNLAQEIQRKTPT